MKDERRKKERKTTDKLEIKQLSRGRKFYKSHCVSEQLFCFETTSFHFSFLFRFVYCFIHSFAVLRRKINSIEIFFYDSKLIIS